MATHSTVGFSLSALGAWVVGVALDAAGGPLNPSAWMAAFSVLAAGILLGPVALYWSQKGGRCSHEQRASFRSFWRSAPRRRWRGLRATICRRSWPIRSARDLGVSSNWIFAAFSASLVISALLGPRVGRQIDLVGGRSVLSISNLTLAAGLALLGATYSIPVLVVAWLLLGIGMGFGLYDAAFAALGRIYGDAARRSITGITLIAGFASTVGWPLTAWGLETHRLAQHLLCLGARPYPDRPADQLLHAARGEGRQGGGRGVDKAAHPDRPDHDPAGVRLCRGLDRHRRDGGALPRILEAAGATTVQAVAAGALFGPAQVVARIIEASFLSRYHPLLSTRLACLTHPIGAAILATGGRRRSKRVRDLLRRRQRHPDHRARHAAAGDLRPAKLWLSARHHRRAGADGAGRSAPGVRSADRHHGQPRPDRLLRAQPVGAAGAVHAAEATAADVTRRRICPSQSDTISSKTTPWKKTAARPTGSEVFVRWAITPPQSYAVYLVSLFLVAGLSFYVGTLKPKKAGRPRSAADIGAAQLRTAAQVSQMD